MRSIKWLVLYLTAILLLLSGCGGNPSGGNPTQPPAALSYTTSTSVYTRAQMILLNCPTSTGGPVTSYSVSPALPTGLSMSTNTGIISGTPMTVTARATYVVTASNSFGSSTASLSITVNEAAPAGLVYTPSSALYFVGTPIAADSPTSTGGPVTSYSVTPTLPAGLSLSTSTGIISGTPTAVAATASYTVTASNSAGSTTAIATITVKVAPLSTDNINLIFVVSQDLAYQDQASGDVNPSTANLTNKGLQRSLLLAPFLQHDVLGMNNVTGIYALEPMTHPQTANSYPDMAALETIQQFALLNQMTLPTDGDGQTQFTAHSYPLNASYAFTFIPTNEIAAPLLFCDGCQGLDFNDPGANEDLVAGIIANDVPGFYVFSAPWETTGSLLAGINSKEGYNRTLPPGYQGPNYVYAISVPPSAPSGSPSLATYNSNLNPPSTYPALSSPGLVSTPCYAQTPFRIPTTGSIPPPPSGGFNTNETVYLVRHAEAHPANPWEDGNYVAAGQWRALDLPSALLGKISPNLVYSIDPAQVTAEGHSYWSYVRATLTVEPYAIANNLPYYLVANFELMGPDSPQQTSDFFFKGGKFSGQAVLLGWEHDHFPPTVDALLKNYGSTQKAPAWPGADYDTIWTVKLDATGNLTVDNAICEGINSAKLPDTAPQF